MDVTEEKVEENVALDEEFLNGLLDEAPEAASKETGEEETDPLEQEFLESKNREDAPAEPEKEDDPITVRVSADMMEAFIVMPEFVNDPEQWSITTAELMELLNDNDISFGVDPMALKEISDHPVFGIDVKIAEGEPPVEGEPGYFIYHFDTELDKKPVIREDGSVDYMAIKSVETVKKDDLIAEYVPATEGTPGTNVFGFDSAVKPARDLPPLNGTGFRRSEDNKEYHADMAGKIEFKNNRIIISPVFETSDDVGTDIGNIEFEGDVIIHGMVTNGAVIRAAGNITIDKIVENAEIYSKKDIVLKAGVKGNEKTKIEAKGNITAQFVEFASVHAGGTIEADVLFNSEVSCDSYIKMNGDHSSIIGGTVTAIEGVEAYLLGNTFGVITRVYVGLSPDRLRRLAELERKVAEIDKGLEKIVEGLKKFDQLAAERGLSYRDDPRRIELLRIKIRNEAVRGELGLEIKYIQELAKRGERARIIVNKEVYPGVEVGINERRLKVKDAFAGVEFRKSEDGIRMEAIG